MKTKVLLLSKTIYESPSVQEYDFCSVSVIAASEQDSESDDNWSSGSYEEF